MYIKLSLNLQQSQPSKCRSKGLTLISIAFLYPFHTCIYTVTENSCFFLLSGLNSSKEILGISRLELFQDKFSPTRSQSGNFKSLFHHLVAMSEKYHLPYSLKEKTTLTLIHTSLGEYIFLHNNGNNHRNMYFCKHHNFSDYISNDAEHTDSLCCIYLICHLLYAKDYFK